MTPGRILWASLLFTLGCNNGQGEDESNGGSGDSDWSRVFCRAQNHQLITQNSIMGEVWSENERIGECSWKDNQQACSYQNYDEDGNATPSHSTYILWNDLGYPVESTLDYGAVGIYSYSYEMDCSSGWCKRTRTDYADTSGNAYVQECAWDGNQQECSNDYSTETVATLWNDYGYPLEELHSWDSGEKLSLFEWNCEDGWCREQQSTVSTVQEGTEFDESGTLITEVVTVSSWDGNRQEWITESKEGSDEATFSGELNYRVWNDHGYRLETYLEDESGSQHSFTEYSCD